MKTIQKESEILRVKDDVADEKVGKYGWKYVPRSIWKEQVRDVKQIAKEVANEGGKKKKGHGKVQVN